MKKNQIFQSGGRPALAMILCSCIAFSTTASYQPPVSGQDAVRAAAPVRASQARQQNMMTATAEETTEDATTVPEEKEFSPAPYLLNLAYQFPDGSTESYAEVLMKELITKDSKWYAEIYDMANMAPLKLGARLGRSPQSVMGNYNPSSKKQDKKDSATWAVEHFKNVKVSFYDGDGNVTSAVSNAQNIISMASVYAYYHDLQDIDAIREYIHTLWKNSHSYSVSMGDVYYCEGCVDPNENAASEEDEDSDLANEDTFNENSTIDTEIELSIAETETEEIAGKETESGEEAAVNGQPETSSAAATDEAGPGNDSTTNVSASAPASTVQPSQDGPTAPQTPPVANGEPSQQSAEQDQTQISENTSENDSAAETLPVDASNQETEGGTGGETPQETAETQSVPAVTVIEETERKPLIIRLDDETGAEKTASETADESASTQGTDSTAVSEAPNDAPSDGALTEETAAAETSLASSSIAQTQAPAKPAAEAKTPPSKKETPAANGEPATQKVCPGHIDLKITAHIYTVTGDKNLYVIDRLGQTAEDGRTWTGWTSRNKAFVRHINRQNWTDEYGLNVTLAGTRAPLSDAEIESYMGQLPSDTTETRKHLIRFALQSVGKVPYYWGGKPDSAEYSGNNFGSVTIPDHRGRILRGLDCSGWVNWVYWAVTGSRLMYEGTDGLKLLGRQVNRQDLKPGDIVVITGSTPHVIMFMNFTADGQIQCVHETGSANNVTVGVMRANWPYYRNLLD